MAVQRVRSQLFYACLILAALGAALLAGPQKAMAGDDGCDVIAAPPSQGGDNANAGTSVNAPVASIRKLLQLVPRGHGEASRGVACVRRGTYDFSRSLEATLAKPWTTLRPFDHEAATLVGRFVVSVKAHHAVVEGLSFNGRRPEPRHRPLSPSLMVFGDGAVIRDNTITNDHTAICVHVSDYYGDRARDVTIAGNEIYGCGAIPHLNHDHGIYIADADGTRILDNFVHDNQDRGIQLWPDADTSLVAGNVVDQNGEGISIGGNPARSSRSTSDRNVIRGNLIMRSHAAYDDPDGAGPSQSNTHGWNLEFVANRRGKGNLVEGNCFFATHPDPHYDTNGGINLSDSLGVPKSYTLGANSILRERPVGGEGLSLERSGCEPDAVESVLPHDCNPVLMNQWTGTPGPDQFAGSGLRDYASAGEGDDSVNGAAASDCLYGGSGNDTLAGDLDPDRLFGDDGDDTVISRETTDADWRTDEVSCGAGSDVVFADITDVVAADCERPLYRDP